MLSLFMFLFSYSLVFLCGFKMHYNIFCDDRCIDISNNGMQFQFTTENGEHNRSQIRESDMDVDLSFPIVFNVYNVDGQFGFSGNLDFYYFSISTNKDWIVEDNKCKQYLRPEQDHHWNLLEQYFLLEINTNYSNFDDYNCYFTYQLDLCKDNTFYIYQDELIFIENLIKPTKSSGFDSLSVSIDYNISFKGQIIYNFIIKDIFLIFTSSKRLQFLL